MDYRESVSSKTYSAQATLFFICVALVTLGSTSAWAIYPMQYSSGQAEQRIEQIYGPCDDRADAAGGSAANRSQAFVECIDRHLGLTGLLFAVLVTNGETGAAGYSWNYQSLTAAYDRARRECGKHGEERECLLKAFAIDGCIAYAKGSDYHGYGVGATAAEARREVLHGRDARSCGPRCNMKQVYCTGS
jgi:hypothetical protein